MEERKIWKSGKYKNPEDKKKAIGIWRKEKSVKKVKKKRRDIFMHLLKCIPMICNMKIKLENIHIFN